VAIDHHVEWTLTTSRRTPESFLQFLQQVQIQIVPVEETDQEWMSQHYAESKKIWVTPDSVSMVYEALTSGAVTKVFSLEPKSNESRVRKGLEVLIHNESVQSFELWKQGSNKQCSPIHFNESARIADHILEQLL
jgi:mitochondrial fission protein ELM1